MANKQKNFTKFSFPETKKVPLVPYETSSFLRLGVAEIVIGRNPPPPPPLV